MTFATCASMVSASSMVTPRSRTLFGAAIEHGYSPTIAAPTRSFEASKDCCQR